VVKKEIRKDIEEYEEKATCEMTEECGSIEKIIEGIESGSKDASKSNKQRGTSIWNRK